MGVPGKTHFGHYTDCGPTGLSQYDSPGEYCGPQTASSVVFVILLPMIRNDYCPISVVYVSPTVYSARGGITTAPGYDLVTPWSVLSMYLPLSQGCPCPIITTHIHSELDMRLRWGKQGGGGAIGLFYYLPGQT